MPSKLSAKPLLPHLLFAVYAAALVFGCARSGSDGGEGATPRTSFGSAMSDVARRFEILGRAASAGRYELADYELGELEEIFTETLPGASPPKEGHPEVLPGLVSDFSKNTIPALRTGIATHDQSKFEAAFAQAASACNSCHQASGHQFIEVPLKPGLAIPNTDPVAGK